MSDVFKRDYVGASYSEAATDRKEIRRLTQTPYNVRMADWRPPRLVLSFANAANDFTAVFDRLRVCYGDRPRET